jgi:predicted Rossmann fold nucleotide-binding protein DprA/Smf involved in DNA uptake
LLGVSDPPVLYAIGNAQILKQPLTALFCSNKCPGSAILRALDFAAQLRDASRAVISGFQTPIEKECLAILLRGKSPTVICPARSIARLRLPAEWKPALVQGRLLLLSPFPNHQHRATTETALRRNEMVATLAAGVTIIYASPGGSLERLFGLMKSIGKDVTCFDPARSSAGLQSKQANSNRPA